MSKKTIGLGLIVVGILILAISLSADYIGLGHSPASIGWKQLIGAGIGLVVALVGVGFSVLRTKK